RRRDALPDHAVLRSRVRGGRPLRRSLPRRRVAGRGVHGVRSGSRVAPARAHGRRTLMIILDQALAQRAADGNPVRIGIVGAGYMGRGIAAHADALVGMQLAAIYNRTSSRAEELLRELGHDSVGSARTAEEVDAAVAAGT